MSHRPQCQFAFVPLILLLFTAAGCTPGSEAADTLHYGLTLAPTGIDPHINASVELGIPLSSVYDTLIFQDPDTGEYVPGLADDWEISEDGRIYRFHLRSDVHFHDGEPFNAEAVKVNLAYIQDPDHRSQKALAMLGPIREVRVVDDYTVELHLDSPYAPLLDSLSQVYLGMASPQALEQWGAGDYQFHQVGTGPYRFVEYEANDHLTLERNEEYAWGPSIYQAEVASIERIEFRFFEDQATRALALESGEVDIIGELPALEARRLSASPEFEIHPIPIPGQPLQFIFNVRNQPTDDPLVRRALIQGVDRVHIVDTVFGGFSPVAQASLSSTTLGYSDRAVFPGYDFDAAAELLDSAGWRLNGPSGVRQKDGIALELVLVVPDWGSNPEVGQLVAAAWGELGARVELQVAPGFGPLTQAQQTGDYHAIGMNSFGTDPDLLRPFFHSGGFFNWSGYQDPTLDALLAQAASIHDTPGERQRLYGDIGVLIRDQALIIPIREYVNLIGTHERVSGLRFSLQGWFPYLIDVRLRP